MKSTAGKETFEEIIFDIHVHVGQFEKRYFSPEYVCKTLQKAGVTHFAFSSFSHIASSDKGFLLAEREKVLELSQNRAVVFQWVMPEMVAKKGGLESWPTAGLWTPQFSC